eukprot:6186070-Pleurochrysis_carterae.AAC.3
MRVIPDAARDAAEMAVAALPDHATEADMHATVKEAEQQVLEQEFGIAWLQADDEVVSVLTLLFGDKVELPQSFKDLLGKLYEKPFGVGIAQAPFMPAVAAELVQPLGLRVINFSMELKHCQFCSRAHEKATLRWFDEHKPKKEPKKWLARHVLHQHGGARRWGPQHTDAEGQAHLRLANGRHIYASLHSQSREPVTLSAAPCYVELRPFAIVHLSQSPK